MINCQLQQVIEDKLGTGKAILVIGARQVGKTTLVKNILDDKSYLFLNGDDPTVADLINAPNTEQLKSIIGNHKFLFIDEAQRLNNIGLTLKLITDQFPDVQLLVSGSSAFELKNLINEPLTGRKWQYHLYPIAWQEFEENVSYVTAQQQLEQRLLYGMYPEIITNPGEEQERLKELAESYLYKDILALYNVRKPVVLENLVKALAYQLGNEVSYNELSQLLGIDKNTVSAYVDILENNYVIFKLPSYSKNLRTEIKRNQKIYFYDNGIRNAIISDFKPLVNRQDKGALWENFLISERLKLNAYNRAHAISYFWRTTRKQEIDYIELKDDKLSAYEFKWKARSNVKFPKSFTTAYEADLHIIDQSNFRNFLKN